MQNKSNDISLMNEHIKNIEKLPKEKYNGLLCYTYNEGIEEKGYYNPKVMNMGDYIQSLAAKQFIESVDEYIDRDQLGIYSGKKVNVVLNAWYYIWTKNEVFSDKIRPLLIAIHIDNLNALTVETLKYLKEHEPIGCRDLSTKDFLLSKGIRAYFSGCCTLTLGNTYKVSDELRKDNIYFVDYKVGRFRNRKIDTEIKKILKNYQTCKINYLSHMYALNKNISSSLKEAEQLILRYARARLVITTNIHCALPCLSLGTPVILIVPEFDDKRFNGLVDLLNFIGVNSEKRFVNNVNMKNGFVFNSDDYQKYKTYITKICSSFFMTSNCSNSFSNSYEIEKLHQDENRSYKISYLDFFKRKIKKFFCWR